MSVSRETSPQGDVEREPAYATEVFGDGIGRARRFAGSLAREGELRGLLGPLENARLWSRHLLNCAAAAPLFATGSEVGDIGSGAGLPGIVLAIARPDVAWTLIEPMERRVAWLSEQVADLELEHVTVLRARAEDVPRESFDAVTARAVSALRGLVPLAAPLVRDGGELIFLKGASVAAEIDAARKQLAAARVSDPRVDTVGDGVLEEPTRVFRGTVRRARA